MVWLVKRIALASALVLVMAVQGIAGGAYSVAFRVNEAVISNYDIDQRVKMLRALGVSGPNPRESATQALIDDRLKAETARNLGMVIDRVALDRAIDRYAAQRNMTSNQLMTRFRRAGVAVESFEEFLTVSLVWRSILTSRFGAQANPSEIELNAQLNTIAVSSASTIQIGEIILPYLGRGQDATVALATQIIAQLKAGEDFGKLARAHSRARSAEDGGVIGWVSPNRLPPQIGAAVRGLTRGGIAEPIYIPSGIVIIKVLDSRTVSRQIRVPIVVSLTYAELVIPYASAGSAREAATKARRLRRALDGCRGLTNQAAELGAGSGVFGPVSLDSIATDIGLGLARLDPRESMVLQGENSLRVLVLCDRVSEMSLEGRAQLRNQLFSQNIGALSQGYLLELRRSSIIEKQ